MALKENDLTALRNELDRLYKNWVVINGRALRLMEKLRTSATRESEADAPYWKSYGHWKAATPHSSFYGEEIAQAVQALDPRWSKTWANYAADLKLEPDAPHNPPVFTASERENPPSNSF
jgi:hypothetical protein